MRRRAAIGRNVILKQTHITPFTRNQYVATVVQDILRKRYSTGYLCTESVDIPKNKIKKRYPICPNKYLTFLREAYVRAATSAISSLFSSGNELLTTELLLRNVKLPSISLPCNDFPRRHFLFPHHQKKHAYNRKYYEYIQIFQFQFSLRRIAHIAKLHGRK